MVYIRNGRNLGNINSTFDADLNSDPDPYVKSTAVSSAGKIFYKKTSSQHNSRPPGMSMCTLVIMTGNFSESEYGMRTWVLMIKRYQCRRLFLY